ncbi:MAG: FAD:protein FMN transferase [Lachnospiraceae bacterium]
MKKLFMYRLIVLLILLFTIIFFIFKQNAKPSLEPISITSFKLNTFVSIQIYDSTNQALLEHAMELCDTYELLFSRTNTESEVYKTNNEYTPFTPFLISKELNEILTISHHYYDISNGYFSPYLMPLTSIWNFTDSNPQLPLDEDIKNAIAHSDFNDVLLKDGTIQFAKAGMGIDLGGIAKGYIADKIKEYFISEGVTSAIINLGGNVLCIGEKEKDVPFTVGIRNPFSNATNSIATINILDKTVVSSGIYERSFTYNDTLYHHILNPHTGYPVDNDILSITIVCDSSTDADALSTICLLLGSTDALTLLESLDHVDAFFILKDGSYRYTKDFEQLYNLEFI